VDSHGNPIFQNISLKGVLPEGETADSVERLFRRRDVRVEFIFVPEAPWALPRKGSPTLTGCRGRLEALRVTTANGAVLAQYEGH
jgi:hypothetical protein